jgi:hypothetical protein
VALYDFGGTPDSYVADRDTGERMPAVSLTILDAETLGAVTGLFDELGAPAATITTDTHGYYQFSCESAAVVIRVTDSLGVNDWGPISSPEAVRDAVEAVDTLTAASAAASAAAAAATATAEAAQADADAAQVDADAALATLAAFPHSSLTSRSVADSHPIAAITGLQAALDAASTGGGTTVHNNLTGRSTADAHPTSAITGLDAALSSRALTVHNHAGTDITSGLIAAARLGAGTPSALNYLRGDGVWAVPSGGGGGTPQWGPFFANVQDHGAVGNGVTDDAAAIRSAIVAAGAGGTVFFPATDNYYRVNSSIKPYERQEFVGQHSPRYWWGDVDSMGGRKSIIRAGTTFTGSAVIYNNNTGLNGRTSTSVDPSCGVQIRNLGIFGNGEEGAVDGIDLGPTNGAERAWLIDRCQIAYCSTGISGYQWVVTVKDSMIGRNGWGIAPHRGADGNSRAQDCVFMGNYIYFNAHHAVELGGPIESGMCGFYGNRFERSGVSMNPMDPNVNRDPVACGVLLTRCTAISLVGNSTDANAGPGLRIQAQADGVVNNVVCVGNVWKRDGTGDNAASLTAGVSVDRAKRVTFSGNAITYGDPNDGGTGRSAPQYGLEIINSQFITWIGTVELASGRRTNGYRFVSNSATHANYNITIQDPGYPVLGIPAVSTGERVTPPTGSLVGSIGWTYFDRTTNALTTWNGTAWVSGAGSVSPEPSGGAVQLSQVEYDALASRDAATVYAVTAPGGVKKLYVGSTQYSQWTQTFIGLRNSFVGIPSGDVITFANSGGASGDAFPTIVGTPTANTSADLTTAYDRGMIAPVAASTATYVQWTHSDYAANGYFRFYMRRAAAPPATQRLMRGLNGATVLFEVRWQADGLVILANGNSGAWYSSVAGATGLNTVYRVEGFMFATGGELRVYAGESQTVIATATPVATAPVVGAWDTSRFGLMHTAVQTDTVQLAAVAVSNTDWLGPAA